MNQKFKLFTQSGNRAISGYTAEQSKKIVAPVKGTTLLANGKIGYGNRIPKNLAEAKAGNPGLNIEESALAYEQTVAGNEFASGLRAKFNEVVGIKTVSGGGTQATATPTDF